MNVNEENAFPSRWVNNTLKLVLNSTLNATRNATVNAALEVSAMTVLIAGPANLTSEVLNSQDSNLSADMEKIHELCVYVIGLVKDFFSLTIVQDILYALYDILCGLYYLLLGGLLLLLIFLFLFTIHYIWQARQGGPIVPFMDFIFRRGNGENILDNNNNPNGRNNGVIHEDTNRQASHVEQTGNHTSGIQDSVPANL